MKSTSQKVWDHVDFTGHWEGFTLKSPQKQGKPEDNGTAITYWKAIKKERKPSQNSIPSKNIISNEGKIKISDKRKDNLVPADLKLKNFLRELKKKNIRWKFI